MKIIDLHILTYILLALCFLLLLSVLIVPSVTGLRFDEIVSVSREPTINPRASIAIGKVDPAQAKVGDIIGFKIPSTLPLYLSSRWT